MKKTGNEFTVIINILTLITLIHILKRLIPVYNIDIIIKADMIFKLKANR